MKIKRLSPPRIIVVCALLVCLAALAASLTFPGAAAVMWGVATISLIVALSAAIYSWRGASNKT